MCKVAANSHRWHCLDHANGHLNEDLLLDKMQEVRTRERMPRRLHQQANIASAQNYGHYGPDQSIWPPSYQPRSNWPPYCRED